MTFLDKVTCGEKRIVPDPCFVCQGEGTVSCIKCNGWGTYPDLDQECSACRGSGEVVCLTCDGTGEDW